MRAAQLHGADPTSDQVSGLTTVIAFRMAGKHRYSQTKINRSMLRSRTRDGDLRLRTITCRRSAKFSASRLARDFSGLCEEHEFEQVREHRASH
jgi:hypothetical protein